MTPIERLPGDPPSPYEGLYGFSRVTKASGLVIVSGTTSVDPTGVVLGETPYEQTQITLRKIEHVLGRAGATLDEVVNVRIYVTDPTRADEVGKAHGEFFGEIRPSMTLVGVTGLIDPRMMVEIEVFAVID